MTKSDKIKWGPAIDVKVVRERPDWLKASEICAIKDRGTWLDEGGTCKASEWYWHEDITQIKLLVDHAYYTVQKYNEMNGTSFTYWGGQGDKPVDYDGGRVVLRDGSTTCCPASWSHPWRGGSNGKGDVIGYTRKVEPVTKNNTEEAIPQWALDEAKTRLNEEVGWHLYTAESSAPKILARMIVKYEQPPVDPDEEALKRILKTICVVKEHCGGNWHSALAQYKKEIGRG